MKQINKWVIVSILVLINLSVLVKADYVTQEKTPLQQGWNFFSITVPNQNDSLTDRNISLTKGFNLIGISTYENFDWSIVRYSFSNGTVLTQAQAENSFFVERFWKYWTTIDGQQGYAKLPLQSTTITNHTAYWVRSNVTDLNITLPSVGGGYVNASIRVDDLLFTNGTTILNVTQAIGYNETGGYSQTDSWIGRDSDILDSILSYWNAGRNRFESVDGVGNLSTFKGYNLWVRKTNISIIFGNKTIDEVPNVTIIDPQRTTYQVSKVSFNASLNEQGYMNYSLDNGINNKTMTANASNTGFTAENLSIADGMYNVVFYGYDLTHNLNRSQNVTFGIATSVNINLKITGTQGGRFANFYALSDNKSISSWDSRDGLSATTPSNYTTFFSKVCASGTTCNLGIDSKNVSSLPIEYNLTYNLNPSTSGLLNLTWNWNQAGLNAYITDYGTDSNFVTPVSSTFNMKNYVGYTKTLSSQTNNFFRLRIEQEVRT